MWKSVRLLSPVRHQIISKRNWDSVSPDLHRAIMSADFISIDYELTGLHMKNDRYLGLDVAYSAHCEGVKAYVPVQLGICAARFDKETETWSLTPASIYLYPSSQDESGRTFSVSTSALNFLVDNGFDCNEWISHGLSWLRPFEEQDKRRAIKARMDEILAASSSQATSGAPEGAPTGDPFEFSSDPDKELMESLGKRIREWQASDSSLPLEVPMESAFTRLLAHSYIAHTFPTLFSNSVKRGDQRMLCVYQNKADLQKEQLSSLELEMQRIDHQIGVRNLFDSISARRIPLVGHNCFYDLLHTHQSFYEEVPPHVEQFKAKWMSKFARTFDTKFLAECNEVLGGLHPPATLKGLCDFMIEGAGGLKGLRIDPLSPQFEYALPSSSSNDHSHDAGYDAMMTSLVFILQLRHIMERKSLKWEMIEWKGGLAKDVGGGLKVPLQEVLRQSVNRIRIVKTQPSVINLAERQ